MIEGDAVVAFNTAVARETRLMGLRFSALAARATPGQFAMIRVRGGFDPLLRRPFSIAGVRGGGVVLFLYRVVGRGTKLLSEVRKGQRLSVLGPLGKGFDLSRMGRRPLLVAGGIGLPPLAFLSNTLKDREQTLLAGYRSSADMIPGEPLGLQQRDVAIATDDGTAGVSGTVIDLLTDRLKGLGEGFTAVVACGPLAMLRKIALLSMGKGIPCQVSLEARMACGLGACQGCAVKAAEGFEKPYFHVCQDGPVFDVNGLDWEALETQANPSPGVSLGKGSVVEPFS
jgi:dihydroorotate dehydrogenase electron transfer subunit